MLRMSIRTVEVHRSRIMRKMEATTPISLACDLQCAQLRVFPARLQVMSLTFKTKRDMDDDSGTWTTACEVVLGLFICLAWAVTCIGAPVPIVGRTPVDVGRVRLDNPSVITTNGTWRFKLARGAMVHGKFAQQLATASSTQQPPDDALDNDPRTRWCAESGSMPQWWQVDLGAADQIAGVDLKVGIWGWALPV